MLAALWIFFEEWIWNSLTAATAWLARRLPLRRLETRLRGLGPYAAMTVFLVPWLLLLPAKVLVVWLLGTGRFKSAVLVYVVAKVVGMTLIVRLFALTRPALMQVGWFRRLHAWFMRWRDRLHAYVRSLRAWQAVKAMLARVRSSVRALWQRLRARA